MIYGIEGTGAEVSEVVRFPSGRERQAVAWAAGETTNADGDFETVEGRRLFRAPRGWKWPESKPASNPLRHIAYAIEAECDEIEGPS